jgi:hypothetical protein
MSRKGENKKHQDLSQLYLRINLGRREPQQPARIEDEEYTADPETLPYLDM